MSRSMFFFLLSFLAATSFAETFVSKPQRPVVIELFTSEGCSSCPPAERWLNQFIEHPLLWHQFFPLAWHVDYWDQLGWPDPYADRSHSFRQRSYKRQTALNSVYTPGVLVNGVAWRGWRRGGSPPQASAPVPGILHVELRGKHFEARLEPINGAAPPKLELHAAVLGFGLSTDVKRGENRGRKLEHEFVVLSEATRSSRNGRWTGELSEPSLDLSHSQRQAVVFWLESASEPTPLVITGGWLKSGWQGE